MSDSWPAGGWDDPTAPFGDGPVHQTAHAYVRDVLRRAILNGELAGGTRLVQGELAATLDVSTTPVREALRDLSTEGLVRFDAHRGALVTELDGSELRDIYEVRETLEVAAMQKAVGRLDGDALAGLDSLHDRMSANPHRAEFVDWNRAFHMSIYQAGTSPRMMLVIRNLADAAMMYIGASLERVEGLRERAVADHGDMLAALQRGDTVGAVDAVRRHIQLPLRALTALGL